MPPQNNYSEIDKRFDERRLKQACHCEDCMGEILKIFGKIEEIYEEEVPLKTK